MSEYDYAAPHAALPPPPLPPPPPAPPSPLLRHTPQTSPLRRIAVQPPIITTALAPPRGTALLHGHTPASATSLSVPFSPYAPSPSSYTPSPVAPSPMAMRNAPSVPYNPQQWGRNGRVPGQYVPHSTTPTPVATSRPQEVTGMEGKCCSLSHLDIDAVPPPPYSPGQNQSMSQSLSSSPHVSARPFPPASAIPDYVPSPPSRPVSGYVNSRPTSMVIPSSATSIQSNPQFPPPPPRNGKERAVSRDKPLSKFSLSSFRNRNLDHSPAPSAIESLHINTSEALQRAPASPGFVGPRGSQYIPANAFPERRWSPESQSPVRPPGSRRAASAGVLGHATETRTPIEASPSLAQGAWDAVGSLPPPPPGPPPGSSRSQSLGRGLESNANRLSVILPAPPTRRPGQSILTPIPPTPLGWQEEPSRPQSRSPAVHGLHIDTSPRANRAEEPSNRNMFLDGEDVSLSSGPTASTSHSNSTLYRSAPQREHSAARGIRERRSESRAARERTEPSNNPWAQDLEAASSKPDDLVIGTPDGSISRRGATKGTPRSAGAVRSPRSSRTLEDPESSNSTPRLDSYQRVILATSAPTPPFSPGTEIFDHHHAHRAPTSIPSKALPTPPLRYYGDDQISGLTSDPGAANRGTSQASRLPESQQETSSSSTPRPAEGDSFSQRAIERHRQFIEQEMSAATDQDRLELFAEFFVTESRIRRDRYSGAFDAIAGDVVDLTRDLWRSYSSTGRRSATPGAQGTSLPSGRRSQASTIGDSPDTRFSNSVTTTAASPASSVANFTPHTEPASPSSATSQRARDASWNNNYQPCLSPIPSMAVSTVPDDQDSRGRSASRWWEASNDGASSGIGGKRLERSKRESKYMGLPKEARESLQWAGEDTSAVQNRAGSSTRPTYAFDEYPPEKVGLHEETEHVEQALQLQHEYFARSGPNTPDPRKLDVSRLVTLPPPYPRHHPAVNNSHPDLASIRSNLRSLADLNEVKSIKEPFNTKTGARKEQASRSLVDQRAQLRFNIEENVRNGVMSYADATKAESDFEAREHQRAQDLVQNIFDSFQAEVANPLHAMFCERVTKVSASIEHLRGRLLSDAQELNPNQTQEEGDEQPELLEMLTLLKWLFEAREQLHKELLELEDERNELYKDIIILPYIQSKNNRKVKEAADFFHRDAQDRKVTFEKEILKRYEEFMNVIEENVTRGVEAQLSAFWDIVPGLLDIVQKVPERLQGFDVSIPPREFEENPVYHDFPMQYLYSLLAHAGRSAYQFIESQTNLLCLLHEVKTGVMNAGSRLLETQRILAGADLASVESEMGAIRSDEERRLTDDLKDKVGLVESQWGEAFGQGLEECKARVETFLTHQGGWDDSLKE